MPTSRQIDPTRTTMIRKALLREYYKQIRRFRLEIYTAIVSDDSFGLTVNEPWKFLGLKDKVKGFTDWVSRKAQQVFTSGWEKVQIRKAFTKSGKRSIRKADKDLANSPVLDQMLEGSDQMEILMNRTSLEFAAVATRLSKSMAREVSEGLMGGETARQILDRVDEQLDKEQPERLIHTEVTRAAAWGALVAYGILGIEEVVAEVEFTTQGDSRVCPECSGLNGRIYKVEESFGVIPVHPRCRCYWNPA